MARTLAQPGQHASVLELDVAGAANGMAGPKNSRRRGIIWLAAAAPPPLTGKFLRDRELSPW